jgi:putative membrane protein
MTDALVADMTIKTILLMAAVAFAPACSDNDDSTTTDTTTDSDTAIAEGQSRGQANADLTNSELAGNPDDLVISKSAAISITIDQGEIMQAQLALQVATDEDVRAFANRMIAEHSQHMQLTSSMLSAVELQPQDNPVAATLRAEAEAGVAQVEQSADPDYDYIRLQVMMHAEAEMVVTTLRDNAPGDDIAAFYETTRVDIVDHLDDAASMLDSL